MKEQIEEMAKIIAVQRGYDCASHERCEESCIVYRCNPYAYAEILYNAGYRKQSEGEWIVDAWDGEKFITVPYQKHEHTAPYCSLCKSQALLDGAEFGVASNYCHNCGARMKGADDERAD